MRRVELLVTPILMALVLLFVFGLACSLFIGLINFLVNFYAFKANIIILDSVKTGIKIAFFLVILPTLLTCWTVNSDGICIIGFPIPFYYFGGHCRRGCGTPFLWWAFIIDVFFVFMFPKLYSRIVERFRKK